VSLNGEEQIFPTVEELVAFYNAALQKSFKSEDDLDIGKVKEIAINTFVPDQDENRTEEPSLSGTRESPRGGSVELGTADPQLFGPVETQLENLIAQFEGTETAVEIGTSERKAPEIQKELHKKKAEQRLTQGLFSPCLPHLPELQYLAKLNLNDNKYPTKWLYLFSDSLSLSSHEFALRTTWIENLRDDFKGGVAFRLFSPEKRIVVHASNKEEKQIFLARVNDKILEVLDAEDGLRYRLFSLFIYTSRGERDGKKRYAKYTFLNGAYYEGKISLALV
jgi:hypothetical protein